MKNKWTDIKEDKEFEELLKIAKELDVVMRFRVNKDINEKYIIECMSGCR
jgi:hypothetical protein